MSTIKSKSCPRCSISIECKPYDIANCACSTISISNKTKIFLYRVGLDCHCNACLEHYDAILSQHENLPFPTKKEHFIEGLHHYKEGKTWVFTEIYHLLRGHCCESNCRHCPFGYKENEAR